MATSFSGGKRVAVPPMVCAVLWVCALHRRGWSLFGSLPTDITVALVTVAASLTFLVVAFDLSRLMAWTYFSFLILMIFYLFAARPITPPPNRQWLWGCTPLAVAIFSGHRQPFIYG